MEKYPDNVANIHNRFSLTLLNPSSHYFSLAVSLAISALISVIVYVGYLEETTIDEMWYRIPLIVGVLAVTQFIDVRFTKKKEYSKSLHSSLFGNMLWVVTLLMGLLASIVLAKEASLFFVTFGMLLFASFRVGIYTTTLGVNLKKAWAICLVQPLSMFLVLVPQELWVPMLTDPLSLSYGISFVVISSVWSVLTDRAGRPGMESTHKTIQAYLASQGNDFTDAEDIMEKRSNETRVTTLQIRLSTAAATATTTAAATTTSSVSSSSSQNEKEHRSKFTMILPDIHPGPYHPVGGSNIPYMIYKKMASSAMVMHSISDHSLNLPSKEQVEKYLKSLDDSKIKEKGFECTEPIIVQINKARVNGMLFGNDPLLILSLSPHGMEDIPSYMKKEITQYAKSKNYTRTMIVDSHNAMGEEISKEDGMDMLHAAKTCLDTLMTQKKLPMEFGYANSDKMDVWTEDLGMGGLGILCLRINGKKYFLGWADANNMENGVREKIISIFEKNGYNLIEICTSDTHYAPVKARNRNGYYQLGLITSAEKLAKWYLEVAKNAEKSMMHGVFEIIESETTVRVMGQSIYEDYSKALDNSLKITKGFVIGCTVLFTTSLFL